MSLRSTLFALLLAAGLLGCGKQLEPRHIVILIDVSGSIDRQALDQAFKAIDELVGHLRRGDRIVIIPILGDAQAEASGRIIRFQVPINRQAYDSDLQNYRVKIKNSLERLGSYAVRHPEGQTDILGSIALAEQEFQAASGKFKRLLIILSDFIQEDRNYKFQTDKSLSNPSAARQFAVKINRSNPVDFKGLFVYMGLLRSNEYSGMKKQRRLALEEFWLDYFKSAGAQPRFRIDGLGLFANEALVY